MSIVSDISWSLVCSYSNRDFEELHNLGSPCEHHPSTVSFIYKNIACSLITMICVADDNNPSECYFWQIKVLGRKWFECLKSGVSAYGMSV